MNRPRLVLVLVAAIAATAAVVKVSLARPPAIPTGRFRLDVDRVVADRTLAATRLTITTAGAHYPSLVVPAVPVSLETHEGRQTVVSPATSQGDLCSADVLLIGDLLERRKGPAEIKLLLQVRGRQGASAGGPSLFQVSERSVAEVLSVDVRPGLYRLDSPLTIGTLQGKPITLVVGPSAEPDARS
jgi:hypothetical protein